MLIVAFIGEDFPKSNLERGEGGEIQIREGCGKAQQGFQPERKYCEVVPKRNKKLTTAGEEFQSN